MEIERVRQFIDQNGITALVLADASDGNIQVIGHPDQLESDELIRQYFRNADGLNDSLQGRIQPRMLQHGNVFGCYFELSDGRVVAFLYNDDSDPVERYHRANRLYEARELLEPAL